MRSKKTTWYLFSLLLPCAIWIGITARAGLATGDAGGWLAPLPSPTPTPAAKESWLILPPMPADATEADIGAEIYALVCRDCHGDRGQGLTDEFRATWAPKDQNCWQSKCHAPNHLIEGFELPRYIPAINGPGALTRFDSADDLQAFIAKNMPWHNPGSLTEAEYWQLTAYILRENAAHTSLAPDASANGQP